MRLLPSHGNSPRGGSGRAIVGLPDGPVLPYKVPPVKEADLGLRELGTAVEVQGLVEDACLLVGQTFRAEHLPQVGLAELGLGTSEPTPLAVVPAPGPRHAAVLPLRPALQRGEDLVRALVELPERDPAGGVLVQRPPGRGDLRDGPWDALQPRLGLPELAAGGAELLPGDAHALVPVQRSAPGSEQAAMDAEQGVLQCRGAAIVRLAE
mmetsp:Transcript_99832/g.311922  ORF Transcript_99832/g.311922 Transcript_99832/m.311922 type:complete len:209 (+) Transcript_99832:59-685(+)